MPALITTQYFTEQMATLGLKSSFAPSAYSMETLIAEASEWVEDYCDRKFELQTVTELIRGPVRVQNKMVLGQWPVASVASAYWVDSSNATGALDVSNIRVLPGGVIEFKNPYLIKFYPECLYTVTYQTGYSTIPRMVQRATALKIALLVQPQYQGPQEREIFMVTNLEQMIVDALEPFRRERLG